MRRRVEVAAFVSRRVVLRLAGAGCPLCLSPSELLTTRQAAALLQVSEQTIRRWLARDGAHGVKTPGGQHRVCRNSLFYAPRLSPNSDQLSPLTGGDEMPQHKRSGNHDKEGGQL